MNKELVGTWWVYKNYENNLFTYKGPSGPINVNKISAYRASDAELGWMHLSDRNNIAYTLTGKVPSVTSNDFLEVVDCSLLDLNPGDVLQIEIFSSGNWIMYDT